MLVIDTHALIWDALQSGRLSAPARRAIERGDAQDALACCDISLWEIAMLIDRGRLTLTVPPGEFMNTLLARRGLRVLPVTVEIALRSQQLAGLRDDPADSLIAATALEHGASVVSADKRIAALPGVRTIW